MTNLYDFDGDFVGYSSFDLDLARRSASRDMLKRFRDFIDSFQVLDLKDVNGGWFISKKSLLIALSKLDKEYAL